MKIGLYSPYIDSFGGGERYIGTLAEHWSKKHILHMFWDDSSVVNTLQERFGLDLSHVTIVPNVFASGHLISKLLTSATYDLIVFLTDGSVPLSLAKHNILHVQVPFSHMPLSSWKSSRYQYVVCNSVFTKDNLDPSVQIPRLVIYPPVDPVKTGSSKKEHSILSVGRFSSFYNAKKQNVMIEAFQKLTSDKQFSGWKLVLAGSVLPGDAAFVEALQKKAKGSNIEFQTNASHADLEKLYGKATIYWHAAGYEETKPEHMEHFGISTVEAMSAGCVAVVHAKGGQKEIVTDGVDGYTWGTIEELIKKTHEAVAHATSIAKKARIRSNDFSKQSFCNAFDRLLQQL